MDKSKIRIFLSICLALILFEKTNPIFISRYVTPDPFFSPILPYRSQLNTISIQPFIMTAGEAHISKHEITTKSRKRLGEMGEIDIFDMQKLNKSIKKSGLSTKNYVPSEWLGYGMPIQMQFGGKITGAGLSWNINKNIVENFSIGWESGIFSSQSAISLDSKVADESFILKEGFLFDIFSTYKNLTKTLKLSNLYEKKVDIMDQNIYKIFNMRLYFILTSHIISLYPIFICIYTLKKRNNIEACYVAMQISFNVFFSIFDFLTRFRKILLVRPYSIDLGFENIVHTGLSGDFLNG